MLLSSLAEKIYWFSRYVERTENTARIVLVNNNLLLDTPRTTTFGWEPIVSITGVAKLFYERHKEATERNVIRFLLIDKHNPGCMLSTLGYARENLRTARGIFPREVWETLNDLHEYVKTNSANALARRDRYNFLDHVINTCHVIQGMLSVTMRHDQAYEFIRLGRNIERADMTTRVIDVRAGNLIPKQAEELKPFDDIQWKSVLDSLAAYLVYRRCVHVRVFGPEVLRFLLKDVYFPRSVMYCLNEMRQCLHALPSKEPSLKILEKAQRLIKRADVTKNTGDKLNKFVDKFQVILIKLDQEINSAYFSLPDDAHQGKTEKYRVKIA